MIPNPHSRLLPVAALALGAAATLLTGCNKEFSQKDVDRSVITLAEVRALTESKDKTSYLIADARGPKAYAAGHIPGAVSFSVSKFSGKYGETDPALESYDTIVVYGDNPGSGSTSGVALRMMSTGYDNVRAFFEGMDAWKRAGMPVEALETPPTPPTPPGAEAPAKK